MDQFIIRTALPEDYVPLCGFEHHVPSVVLRNCLKEGRMLIAEFDGGIVGWLRWNLFWDVVPFMNHLYILEMYRGRGFGRMIVERWENNMRAAGHDRVMTSSAQDEYAQHFYVRLGYRAIGGFTITGDPLEILFEKCFAAH